MKKFRFYVNKINEEKWLNEMCSQGWALKSFFLAIYTFEKCEPGEYTYQIDLIDLDKKCEYFEFMHELDVEIVATWFKWVFLRKRTRDGKFELYSEKESLINHYKEILNFLTPVMFLELFAALIQMPSMFLGSGLNMFSFILLLSLFFVVLSAIINIKATIKKLEEEI